MTRPTATPTIRWMLRRDYSQVLKIDNASFDLSLQRDELVALLRRRDTVGKVIEWQGDVIGYAIQRFDGVYLHIERMAIAPMCQYQGFGTQLIKHMKTRNRNREALIAYVPLENNEACEFFSSMDFRVARVLSGDLLEMVWPVDPVVRDIEEIAARRGWG